MSESGAIDADGKVRRATVEECMETLGPVVAALIAEIHPTRHAALDLGLDRTLERDLGFDSLSRVELMVRVEQAFAIRMPTEVARGVETVRDLVRAVMAAEESGEVADRSRVVMPAQALQNLPTSARTLIDVLYWHAERHGDRTQVWLYEDDADQATELTFADLAEAAERVAAGLLARELQPHQPVAIMLPTCSDFFAAYFGILLAGGVPVPLYPPARPSQIEEHLRRQAAILATAEAPLMITVDEAKRLGRFLCSRVPTLRELVTVAELSTGERHTERPALAPEDTAFLQFTSGSTGDPKGVVLSHANLLANIRVIAEGAQPLYPEDVFVSWLPLYHDMGLIGAVLATTYLAIPLVLMSPIAFLTRPERWLQAIHRHRGSLTAAPNFAYELCVKKVPDAALEGLDLSSWRMTLNGAEPISPGTMARFAERFGPCGYSSTAMTPTYGLAECSLALAMTPVAREPLVDRIDRAAFSRGGRAEPAAGDASVLEFVSCGAPLRGHEIRIVDSSGRELGERREGQLQFRGPSATAGYYRNPEATAKLVQGDGWLDSGDLAYVAGGEVYLTGRAKDVIIRAGRNIYPHELEEAVGALPGVRKGCVAVFGARTEREGTEALVVLAETRESDDTARAALADEIRELAADLLDEPSIEVALAPPHTVLKTSSGKIRRTACRELWEQGKVGKGPRAAWLQLARLTAEGWAFGARNKLGAGAGLLYAGWFWAAVGAGVGLVALPVVTLPGRRARWAVTRAGARMTLSLAGARPKVEGAIGLDVESPVVFVCNHSSYADNLVTTAVLRGDVAVVGKRELEHSWLARLALDRLGVVLVERFDASHGAHAPDQLVDTLAAGRSLLVYPEGTFARMPGLLPFRLGAFLAAARAGVPVVPIVIRGSRSLLRPTTWFPRRSRIEVEVGEPLRAEGDDWAAAVDLRNRVRAVMLAACGEPDLADQDALGDLRARVESTRDP